MAEKFTLETVKWSWAPEVKSPSIYRDDELIRSKTKEEALAAIDFLMNKPKGSYSYTITVLKDGEYLTYWRHSMPCLGGLVKYKDSHGDRYSMNPYFPRDIYVSFPEGDIVFIACTLHEGIKLDSPYYKFILSPESPWVSAFGSSDTIIFKKKYFVLTNMDTDPTVFYSLMRLGCLIRASTDSFPNWNPKAQLLARNKSFADPRRLAGQKPIRISGGTWAQGYGYTRPYNESIFKTCIPCVFEDFSKIKNGYPPVTFTSKYFNNTMKEVFGVDFSSHIPPDNKSEEVLVKAWDYFKEKSIELNDIPGVEKCGESQLKGDSKNMSEEKKNLVLV